MQIVPLDKNTNTRGYRIAYLVKLFYDFLEESFTTKELQELTQVKTIKSIQDDMVILRNIMGRELIWEKTNSTYRLSAITNVDESKRVALKKENKMVVKLALDLLEHGADLSEFRNDVIDDLKLDELILPYYIQPEFYETLDMDTLLYERLQRYILERHNIELLYNNKAYNISPYKLANFDGIWYLYAKDRDDNTLKTWVLNKVQEIELANDHSKHHKSNEEIDDDLESYHSAYFIHGKEVEVKIRVDNETAHLFGNREYVHNQKILGSDDEGWLHISFTVSNYKDVDDMLKSHLPHIEILEPMAFKEKFLMELNNYVHRCKTKSLLMQHSPF